MPPAIAPADPRKALERLAAALHLLPGTGAGAWPVDAIWLRNAILMRLAGQAATLDQALGLPSAQPREVRARERAELIGRLAETTGVASPWGAANAVVLLLAGDHEPKADQVELVAALRADPQTPRSPRHVYRLLQVRATDTSAGVRVSASFPAAMVPSSKRRAS